MKDYYPQINSDSLFKLLERQKEVWETANVNYLSLQNIRERELYLNDFLIRLQYNPGRLASAAAKTDPGSVKNRECFLCKENRPPIQEEVSFGKDYTLLVNPFPVFPQHFTIPVRKHAPQSIFHRYEDMLEMARLLDKFIIFYNGPRCGASAPDHAHFQAGNKGFLPLEQEWGKIEKERIIEKPSVKLYRLINYGRSLFGLEAFSAFESCKVFYRLYELLGIGKANDEEPMMNLIMWYEDHRWITCLFPRSKHRPDCYYAEDEKKRVISPGCIEMGGTWILPIENDFNQITGHDVQAVYKEVSLSDKAMDRLASQI